MADEESKETEEKEDKGINFERIILNSLIGFSIGYAFPVKPIIGGIISAATTGIEALIGKYVTDDGTSAKQATGNFAAQWSGNSVANLIPYFV